MPTILTEKTADLAGRGVARSAQRTPAENDGAIRTDVASFPGPGGTPDVVAILGNRNYKNEDLAREAGYRVAVRLTFRFDVAAFYHDYSNPQTTEPGTRDGGDPQWKNSGVAGAAGTAPAQGGQKRRHAMCCL